LNLAYHNKKKEKKKRVQWAADQPANVPSLMGQRQCSGMGGPLILLPFEST
jgi:hypothetical protein